ncbi:MAG: hypothetical protein LUC16_00215 [Coprobacillus sp.]|nr:hypothetical protein [Coprobacillus sp.]
MVVVECFGKNILYRGDIVGYISRDGLYMFGKKFADMDNDGAISVKDVKVGEIDDDANVIINGKVVGYLDSDYSIVFDVEVPGLFK